MAVTTTELVAEVRTTSDLQQSRFCTDAEILLMVNEVLAELYDDLVMAREGYFQTSVTLTLASNASNLPTDFYKELSVSSGTAPNLVEILPLESYRDRMNCIGPRYWIASRVLTVYPLNVSPLLPVTLDYVPNCPVLADATNIPVDIERFREYLAVGASVKVKAKRKQDATDLLNRQGQLKARIIQSVTARTAGPKKVPMPAREQNRYGWFNNRYNRYGY